MTRSFVNSSGPDFAGFPGPTFGLLRDAGRDSINRPIRIRNTRANARIRNVVNRLRVSLVVTTGHPQAKLAPRQNALTSLHSQGRVANV